MKILYHGSQYTIENPSLEKGKSNNDYGKGFYCTFDIEKAKEWACKEFEAGKVNEYLLNDEKLKILNLQSNEYNVLNWIAILLKNRTFHLDDPLPRQARQYIIDNYYIDTSKYDVVIGYRADDSYFSYAQAFINNTLSIQNLSEALKLGKLGIQIALVSSKAFKNLEYVRTININNPVYHNRFLENDVKARMDYKEKLSNKFINKSDIFVLDLIRGVVDKNDPRI